MTRLPHLKPGFLSQLYTDPAPQLGPRFVTLRDPLRYFSRITGQVHHIPRGFPTDLATFHIGDLELRGQTDRPAVWHDAVYAQGTYRKWLCDILFYEACRSEGMGRTRALLRWAAVTFAPAAHRAYRAHRKGGTPGARFYKSLTFRADSTTNHP